MDIRYEKPFELTFIYRQQHVPTRKFDVGHIVNTEPIVTLEENRQLSVLFNSDDPSARFYMDGLELLPSDEIKTDESMTPFFSPSQSPRIIYFNSDEQSNVYYPLIPGFYRIRVVVKEVEYHALIKIKPKLISEEQWERMRDELDKDLHGLAQDLIRKNLGFGTPFMDFIPSDQMLRFLIIKKHYSNVLSAICDLIQQVNYRIRKEYQMKPLSKVRSVDHVTVQHWITHPENKTVMKHPQPTVDYDLPENQWLLKIISEVSQKLNEIIDSIERYEKYMAGSFGVEDNTDQHADHRARRSAHRTLMEFFELSRKMKNSFLSIKTCPWYQLVSSKMPKSFPAALNYDSRYRALYQLYRDLHSDSVQVQLDNRYSYQWKQSSLLYEIWGFLKICKMLKSKLEYEPISGWVFDQSLEGSKFFIPVLVPGTAILLQRGNVKIRLVYDQEIPEMRKTNKYFNPIYMEGRFHTKPDLRVDVYTEDIYAGSIVIDFKYRRKDGWYGFWNPNKAVSERPTATNQLISYRSNSSSQYLYGNRIPSSIREQIRPVNETWAVYPNYNGDSNSVPSLDQEHKVRFIPLTPGESDIHLVEELKNRINQVLNIMDDIASN
jgi:hypothetical protein